MNMYSIRMCSMISVHTMSLFGVVIVDSVVVGGVVGSSYV